MALSNCHSCKKAQPFLERMMYCSFCGTHYMDIEMFNAEQRVKQDKVLNSWQSGYVIGGMIFLFVVLPLILKSLIKEEMIHNNIAMLALFIWTVLVIKKPFAQAHAQKLYPEKSA